MSALADPVDTDAALLMHDLELELRRQSEQRVSRALEISRDLIDGFRPGEIRRRLGIDQTEYARAHRLLSDALHGE